MNPFKALFFSVALMLTAGFVASASAKELVLITAYGDRSKKYPQEGAFYYIFKSGKQIKSESTNSAGQVTLDWQPGETIKDGYFFLDRFGEFGFTVDEKGRVTLKPLGPAEYGDGTTSYCDETNNECVGKGFYWIQLKGFANKFNDEPYRLDVDGVKIQGRVDARGYILLSHDNPGKWMHIRVAFCAGKTLEMRLGYHPYQSQAVWRSGEGNADLDCRHSRMKEYAAANRSFNGGAPLAMGGWSPGPTPEEKASAEQNLRATEDVRYVEMARANDDLLAWLGPLPLVWSDDEFRERRLRLITKIRDDVRSLPENALQAFVCKTPAQVGDTPQMEDVNAFLEGFPDGVDEAKVNKLASAAKRGNWLAVAQLFVFSNQYTLIDEPRVMAYRNWQLAEWLQARKIGSLYREMGAALDATGYASDDANAASRLSEFDIYAALNSSYPAQFDVGSRLLDAEDPQWRAVGQKMVDCALNALPAYKPLLLKSR